MPELPRSMQEHFGPYAPRDGSRPDPGYREPPPPPPDAGPDAPPDPEPDAGPDAGPDTGAHSAPPDAGNGPRDGLQPIHKV